MSNLVYALICSTVISCCLAATVPCPGNNEDCHDRLMHPDLPHSPFKAARSLADEEKTEFWRSQGMQFVQSKLNNPAKKNRAKNIIMFLGDGMGLTTAAAARNLLGGEEKQLSFEQFPYIGLSKTYSVDKTVSDSACTATAYLCGIKANYGTIGVNANVQRSSCESSKATSAHHVKSIAKWAMDAGKAAGVVTNTRITHASPAGTYANTAERDWEDDSEVQADCGLNSGIEDIAYQLVHGEVGSKLKLMLGGGKRHFIDRSLYAKSKRSRNLIEEYLQENPSNAYVETSEELLSLKLDETARLLGLFADSHLDYHLQKSPSSKQPTLEQMTRRAIEYLSAEENGYFVFIEGGRIDTGHHENTPRIALDETIEFSKAIQAAREMTNDTETLIVVTADHSHAFAYAGYSKYVSELSIVRDCATECAEKEIWETNTYCCTEDGCNGASTIGTSGMLIMLPVLYFAFDNFATLLRAFKMER